MMNEEHQRDRGGSSYLPRGVLSDGNVSFGSSVVLAGQVAEAAVDALAAI